MPLLLQSVFDAKNRQSIPGKSDASVLVQWVIIVVQGVGLLGELDSVSP
jgi:hypothetical protein